MKTCIANQVIEALHNSVDPDATFESFNAHYMERTYVKRPSAITEGPAFFVMIGIDDGSMLIITPTDEHNNVHRVEAFKPGDDRQIAFRNAANAAREVTLIEELMRMINSVAAAPETVH